MKERKKHEITKHVRKCEIEEIDFDCAESCDEASKFNAFFRHGGKFVRNITTDEAATATEEGAKNVEKTRPMVTKKT